LKAIRVANAPCSYGAFEVTVGVLPNVPGPDEVLQAIAGAGYEGTELGPPGYLSRSETLRERLEHFGLLLVGG
jgi:inosose dehydratase